MTLLQCFNQYKGTEVLVPGEAAEYAGQCFQWFDIVLHDVYGLPYFYAAIALDIWTNPGWLLNYFDKITDGSIQAGDIVVYGSGINTSGAGHVDVAAENGTTANYVGYDSNWDTLDLEQVIHDGHDNTFILGSLRLKAVTPTPAPTPATYTVEVLRTCNVRTAPTTTAPLGGSKTLSVGETFVAVGMVTGQSVGGNNQWEHSQKGNYVWSGNTKVV